ncbi:MAG: CheR family methyltransferase [Pseudomonadota bacterium]
MKMRAPSTSPWPRLSALIAESTGLNFPPDRYADLQRGLQSAAVELGFADSEFTAWLLSAQATRRQMQVIVGHLTIGETYFFRERRVFEILATQVVPELLERRRHERKLRIWSAACCTGEEPYSLSILLQQCVPDLGGWHATVLGTDHQRTLPAEGQRGRLR